MGQKRKQRNTATWDVYEDLEKADDRRAARYDVQNKYSITKIAKEDDEEIEEDEAFNSEDELLYADYFDSNKKQRIERDILDEQESESEGHTDDESDEEEETEDESDEEEEETEDEKQDDDFNHDSLEDVDFNFKAALLNKKLNSAAMHQNSEDEEQVSRESSGSEEDENVEELEEIDSENDDSEIESQVNSDIDLTNLIDTSSKPIIRKQNHTIKNLYPESEHAINQKLSLTDLVGALENTTSFGGLKKQVEKLAEREAISIPAPHRLKEKLGRIAAYEEAKTSVSKFGLQVKKNRESDSVKLQYFERPARTVTLSSIVTGHQPQTEMEKEIASLLVESKLTTHHLMKTEELMMNKLSKEEMNEKRLELLKTRNLLFYHELKQKKMSKIKSKTYRKLKRKGAKEVDLETLKSIDPEAANIRMLEMETARAQERMSLKHKNTGKWAKQMLQRKDGNDETHKAIMEQLQKHEDLKQKLMGGGDNSSDDEVLSKEAARDQLLEMKLDAANQEIPVKGLMAMKFMQKHVQDQKDSVLNATKRALLDLESENDTGIDENEHTDTFDVTNEKQVYSDDEQLNTKYFQKFNDEKSSGHERHEEFKLNPDELLNVREKRVLPVVIVDDEVSVSSDDERNPWLQELSVPTQRSKTFKKEIVHTPVIIQSIQPTQTIAISEEESDLDSDKDEVVDHALSKKQVLEMAFGIDEVAEGFESSDVDDKKEDALLGWGSWSNQKTKIKKTKEELVKKVLKRVVIHGKMPKSLKPYLVGSVPHGYENKAQYERTMRMGLGREWNTAAVYQKRIKPRLSMKPGQVILPMK